MAKAEGVSDFVGHQIGKHGADEPLGYAVKHFRVVVLVLRVIFQHAEHVEGEVAERHIECAAVGGETHGVIFAHPFVEHRQLLVLQQGRIGENDRVQIQSIGFAPRPSGEQFLAPRGRGEDDAGIPLRIIFKPDQRFRGQALGRDFRHLFVIPPPERANPAIGQHDVGIENLAGQRMSPGRADGDGDVIVQPAQEIISNILGILVHMRFGGLVLIVHLDGVVDADFGKSVVPPQNALADPPTIAHGYGVLDVKDDGFLRRAQLQLGITLFQIPAIDVADPLVFRLVLAQIAIDGGEISNPVVGDTRLVAGVVRDQADGKVIRLEPAAGIGHFKGDLNILRERLGLGDGGQTRIQAAEKTTENLARVLDEQIVEVDHRLAARTHGHDRDVGQDAIGEQTRNRAFRFRVARRSRGQLGFNQSHALVKSFPVRIARRSLKTGKYRPAGLRDREVILLILPALGEFGEDLAVLLPSPDGVEAGLAVRDGHDFLVAFRDFLERWEVGFLLTVRFVVRLSV